MSKKTLFFIGRLVTVFCLVLSFALCYTGCKKSKKDSSTGDSSGDEPPVITGEVPVIGLKVGNDFVEGYEIREIVKNEKELKEDRAPIPTIKNGLKCTYSVTGKGPDGQDMGVNKSYVFTLSGPGRYEFTYNARSKKDVPAEPVVYSIIYTEPGAPAVTAGKTQPVIIYTGAAAKTIRQTMNYAFAPIVVMNSDKAVTVKGVDPEGRDVVIANGGFSPVIVGEYKFKCQAEGLGDVAFTVNVEPYELLMSVENPEVSLEAYKDMELPEAVVVSSVNPGLKPEITVVSAPEDSNFKAGDKIEGGKMTPDKLGLYTFRYEAKDGMNHEANPIEVKVTVVYGKPTFTMSKELPIYMLEGDKWAVPTAEDAGLQAAYEWKEWTNKDFDIEVKAYATELGGAEHPLEVGVEESLVAGEIRMIYTATAKEAPEVTASIEHSFPVKVGGFDDFVLWGGYGDFRENRNPKLYDRSFLTMEVIPGKLWNGFDISGAAIDRFREASKESYVRFLLHNPNDTTERLIFTMRGYLEGADFEQVIMNNRNPRDSWELNFIFYYKPDETREVVIPRAILYDSLYKIEFYNWTESPVDILSYEMVTGDEAAANCKTAYDFSKGVPAVTDKDGNPVTSGATVVAGKNNTLKFTNTTDDSCMIDLFDDAIDKSVTERMFRLADRGISDPVLVMDITNTGTESVTYFPRLVSADGNGNLYDIMYDIAFDVNVRDPKTMHDPTLAPGKTRTIVVSKSAFYCESARTVGDFTCKLEMKKGELTISNPRFIDCPFSEYLPEKIYCKDKLRMTELNQTMNLGAYARSGRPMTFTSSDESIATVDDKGNVTAVGFGKCKITMEIDSLKVTSEITVKKLPVPRDISDVEGVTVMQAPEGKPLLELDGCDGNYGNIEYDEETGYWNYWTDTPTNDGNNKLTLKNIPIPDDEYLVLQCRISERTRQEAGLWPEIIYGTNDAALHERYFAVFDKQGYDYTSYHDGDLNAPWGTANLEPGEWYFFVDAIKGGEPKKKFGNYYAPFDIAIANVYSVTQAARDALFHVNVKPGEDVPDPSLCAKEAIYMYCGRTANLKAQIMHPQDPVCNISYEVMDGSTVVTVGSDGVVTAGNAAGTCKIKISAEGLDPVYCNVTVREMTVANEFTGEGVTSLGVDCFVPAHNPGDALTLAVGEEGYLTYSSETEGWSGDNEIKFKDGIKVPEEEYLVIQFKYSPETKLDDGLWFAFFGPNETGQYTYDYFMVVDSEGKDYTKYEMATQKGPYGSQGTEPEKWYYLVAYNKGQMDTLKVYYAPFDYTIAGVYTITAEKKDAWVKKS